MSKKEDEDSRRDRRDHMDRQDFRDHQLNRRVAELREKFKTELSFSTSDPAGVRQLEDTITRLNFHSIAYEIVRLDGIAILFLSKAAIDYLGILKGREGINKTIS